MGAGSDYWRSRASARYDAFRESTVGELWDKVKTAADALHDNPEDSSGRIDLTVGDCFASMVGL